MHSNASRVVAPGTAHAMCPRIGQISLSENIPPPEGSGPEATASATRFSLSLAALRASRLRFVCGIPVPCLEERTARQLGALNGEELCIILTPKQEEKHLGLPAQPFCPLVQP